MLGPLGATTPEPSVCVTSTQKSTACVPDSPHNWKTNWPGWSPQFAAIVANLGRLSA